jgi:hypothetical protein
MKKSSYWKTILETLLVAGGIAILVFRQRTRSRRQLEERLDESLAETFPASDPISY